MLNVTSSMAVAFRHLVTSGKRYPGDIVYFAVADEEAGGTYGAERLIESDWDALRCDYVLTEYGGSPLITADEHIELGAAAIRVSHTPEHTPGACRFFEGKSLCHRFYSGP